jgi:hypothetical protein
MQAGSLPLSQAYPRMRLAVGPPRGLLSSCRWAAGRRARPAGCHSGSSPPAAGPAAALAGPPGARGRGRAGQGRAAWAGRVSQRGACGDAWQNCMAPQIARPHLIQCRLHAGRQRQRHRVKQGYAVCYLRITARALAQQQAVHGAGREFGCMQQDRQQRLFARCVAHVWSCAGCGLRGTRSAGSVSRAKARGRLAAAGEETVSRVPSNALRGGPVCWGVAPAADLRALIEPRLVGAAPHTSHTVRGTHSTVRRPASQSWWVHSKLLWLQIAPCPRTMPDRPGLGRADAWQRSVGPAAATGARRGAGRGCKQSWPCIPLTRACLPARCRTAP